MPAVPQIIRMRRWRREKAMHNLTRRLSRVSLGFISVLSILVTIGLIGIAFLYTSLIDHLPSPHSLPLLLEPPNGLYWQPTRLYDRSGEHLIVELVNPAAREKRYLTLDGQEAQQIPSSLVMAMVATAEPGFWQSPGFSWQGLTQQSRQTIAQRLVSNHLFWDEPPGLQRALRESLVAAQITALYGREKVLEWYLNSVDFGRLVFGVDAAARAYFGKPANELSLSEAAALVAIAEAPELDPIDAPQVVIERKNQVLSTVFEQGLINADQHRQAVGENLEFHQRIEPAPNLAPAFTKLVLEQLAFEINPIRIAQGGLSILTSLDYDLQIQAECAADTQLARLSGSQSSEITSIDGACDAARLLPTSSFPAQINPPRAEANVVILDPTTGQVLAIVGESSPGLDPAHQPGHLTGTLLTPFVYLNAFTRGSSPASLVWDIPNRFTENQPDAVNNDRQYQGPVRMRLAMANDYLVPALKILEEIGADQIWHTTRQLGLASLEVSSEDSADGLPLQGEKANLLEISQAFGTFANRGVLAGQIFNTAQDNRSSSPVHPVTLLKVSDHLGKNWLDCTDQFTNCYMMSRPVISPGLAYLINHVLSDEPARWPSLGHPNPLEIGRPAGAKIGQSYNGKDAWTVGYTPERVVGVWLGYATHDDTSNPVSSLGAAGLWHAIMQYATRGTPAEGWSPPPGVSTLQVCDPSGMLPSKNCPVVVDEIFLDGSEPTHADSLFQAVQVNRETGRLATVFTPSELVEERIYLIVPPEAEAWAHTAGLPPLPKDYDLIASIPDATTHSRITSPGAFSTVRGQVPVIGHADGLNFSFYRVQVGQGLNPSTWIQIGEEVKNPVLGGRLALWDTSELNGLYTLQLLVVAEDQSVETDTLQVTVDNQPPALFIRNPTDGELLTFSQSNHVTFQVDATDDLGLEAVEFYIDDKLVGKLTSPPFALPWRLSMGDHILRVRAIDRAGNNSESTLGFSVQR